MMKKRGLQHARVAGKSQTHVVGMQQYRLARNICPVVILQHVVLQQLKQELRNTMLIHLEGSCLNLRNFSEERTFAQQMNVERGPEREY